MTDQYPIPDGLCGVHGCVFTEGHGGVHSWYTPPVLGLDR